MVRDGQNNIKGPIPQVKTKKDCPLGRHRQTEKRKTWFLLDGTQVGNFVYGVKVVKENGGVTIKGRELENPERLDQKSGTFKWNLSMLGEVVLTGSGGYRGIRKKLSAEGRGSRRPLRRKLHKEGQRSFAAFDR